MAAATYGNYEKAGKEIGRASTTVKRQVEQLELWLHRVLVTDDAPLCVTPDGQNLVPVAALVLQLIDQADLKAEITKTRVQADGSLTIEGIKIATPAALEIGKIMTDSRAVIDPNYQSPPTVSPKDIDMDMILHAKV